MSFIAYDCFRTFNYLTLTWIPHWLGCSASVLILLRQRVASVSANSHINHMGVSFTFDKYRLVG